MSEASKITMGPLAATLPLACSEMYEKARRADQAHQAAMNKLANLRFKVLHFSSLQGAKRDVVRLARQKLVVDSIRKRWLRLEAASYKLFTERLVYF